MNKLVPFSKFTKGSNVAGKLLRRASVVMDNRGVPVGFFFGRDTFISFLTSIDEQFEKKAKNMRDGYDNFAGRVIDLIEEKLLVNPKFIKDMELSIADAKKRGWVDLSEIDRVNNG